MHERNPDLLVSDILDAIDRIERHLGKIDRESFLRDEKTIDAVVRNLEVSGEASRRLPEDFRNRNPEIPWRQMGGLRNRIRYWRQLRPLRTRSSSPSSSWSNCPISYLQPFDDVNKRVARLSANIPFIKGNLTPLSFTDVPRDLYTDAVLGVYELRRVDLLKDVFIWAYGRAAARYAAVRQFLGEPDPFRLRHRAELRELVGTVVRLHMGRREASAHMTSWVVKQISADERERFREVVEDELLGLHEGNFARYQITPSEFAAWQEVWKAGADAG